MRKLNVALHSTECIDRRRNTTRGGLSQTFNTDFTRARIFNDHLKGFGFDKPRMSVEIGLMESKY